MTALTAEERAKRAMLKENLGIPIMAGIVVKRIANEICEAEEIARQEWARALISLTPGGSEYIDDPRRSVAFIQHKIEGLEKAMRRFKKRADKVRQIADKLDYAVNGGLKGIDHRERISDIKAVMRECRDIARTICGESSEN